MADEWVKIEHQGEMRYFRRSSINRFYAEVQLIVSHARCVIDPEEIRLAEELEKQKPPRRRLLTEEDLVERAAAKGF